MGADRTRETRSLEDLLAAGEVAYAVMFEPGTSEHTIAQARKVADLASAYYMPKVDALAARVRELEEVVRVYARQSDGSSHNGRVARAALSDASPANEEGGR